MPLLSALLTTPAEGIKITLSTPKSVIEGWAGEAASGRREVGGGDEKR